MTAELGLVDQAIVLAYFAGMLLLGAILARRVRHFHDYFLAGGALTTPLLVCTLVSTYYGLDVTFGTSETAYYHGLAAWFWYSLPYYAFIAFAALVMAPRLKRYQAMTLPDVMEFHFGKGARVLSALACMVYSAPIIAMAGMVAIFQWFGLPLTASLVLTVAVCAAYTMLGGLWADILSDTVQFLLMCVSLAIVIPLGIQWVGGWEFVRALPRASSAGVDYLSPSGGLNFWILLAWSTTGLTVLVEPAFYQRVFAARDVQSITRALLLGIALWAAYDWGVVVVGVVARAAVEAGLAGVPQDLEGKHALLVVCTTLLPTGLRGLFLGGILAAAMSTIDSYSLLASGNLVYDLYRPLLHPDASDRLLTRLTRLGVLVVMAGATITGLGFERLRDAWQFMASVLTGTVLVPMVFALFGSPSRRAGLWGCVSGLVTLIIFYVLLFCWGMYDLDEEAWVLELGNVQIWQDCAALVAIPGSLAGMLLGQLAMPKDP